MFESIISSNGVTISSFLISIFSAIVLGILLSAVIVYRTIHSKNLPLGIAALPPVVALVIMLVNGNIGAGLAVAGTFALVRFRSVPGTAREITGLFTAVAIGLACGMGYVALAAAFCLIMMILILALTVTGFGAKTNNVKRLKILIPENLNYDGIFDDTFEKYLLSWELYKVRTTEMGTLIELNYMVSFKSGFILKEMLDELRCRNGNLEITCGPVNENEMM